MQLLKLKVRAKQDANGNSYDLPTDVRTVCSQALEQHESEIVAWMMKHCDINPYTYEGGIIHWFGWGSAMCWELGLQIRLEFNTEDYVTLTIGHQF